MKRNLSKFMIYWKSGKGYTFLLIVLSAYVVWLIPMVKQKYFSEILFFIFYFLLLSSGIPFLLRNKRFVILLCLSVSPVILMASQLIYNSEKLSFFGDLLMEFYCVCLGTIILMKTLDKGQVTVHRIQGAIIFYLLISLVFALIFHSIHLIQGSASFSGLTTSNRTEFMYFSISTITTVAFGDITPVYSLARSFSNLESLTGQLYPAIIIARLVSMSFVPSKGENKTASVK
jgi:hypothetical protein